VDSHLQRTQRPFDRAGCLAGLWQLPDPRWTGQSHTEVYASIGCVEICNGPEGFNIFNDYIISLAGPTSTSRAQQLLEIGRSRKLVITYAKANRPPVVRW
jgi:hypothetical protein